MTDQTDTVFLQADDQFIKRLLRLLRVIDFLRGFPGSGQMGDDQMISLREAVLLTEGIKSTGTVQHQNCRIIFVPVLVIINHFLFSFIIYGL